MCAYQRTVEYLFTVNLLLQQQWRQIEEKTNWLKQSTFLLNCTCWKALSVKMAIANKEKDVQILGEKNVEKTKPLAVDEAVVCHWTVKKHTLLIFDKIEALRASK